MSRSPDGRPRVYLAGAMERAPDRGRAWREHLLPVLDELGHTCYNPCNEELQIVTAEERVNFGKWKASGHPEFALLMRRIIEHDLAALEKSDYVICYWDEYAQRSAGTPSELTLAHVWGKPVYLVRMIDRTEVSSWVQGCASRTFDSLDALLSYLRQEYGSR